MRNASPMGSAVRASEKLWRLSENSPTEELRAKMASWISAVTSSPARLMASARVPALGRVWGAG
jgi:hypothetical protein